MKYLQCGLILVLESLIRLIICQHTLSFDLNQDQCTQGSDSFDGAIARSVGFAGSCQILQ